MSIIALPVPNLIGGVSQQPEHVRKETHSVEVENCRLSVAEGCDKRHPTNYVAKLIAGADADTFTHFIDRDGSERYLVTIREDVGVGAGDLKVFDMLTGDEMIVKSLTDGAPDFTYLDGTNPSKDLRAVSIADFTFIVNTTVGAKLDAVVSDTNGQAEPGSKTHIHWWVRQAAHSTRFEIRFTIANHPITLLNDEWFVFYKTDDTGRVDTVKVAQELFDALSAPGPNVFQVPPGGGGGTPVDMVTVAGVAGRDAFIADFSPLWDGSHVLLRDDHASGYANDYLQSADHKDGLGGEGIVTMFREVPRFSDLPVQGLPGQILHIRNNDVIEEDDYYVRFYENEDQPDETYCPNGYWAETLAPGITYRVDVSEAPHILKRVFDATGAITGNIGDPYFQFGPGSWESRLVGDADSNRAPSWLDVAGGNGVLIRDVFFHKNRLGFLADDNIILSGAGTFFNFWRTSTRIIKDGDRIDVGAAHQRVSFFQHAVPWQERLVAFTDRTVFVLDGSPILTPRTVQLTPVLEYESNPDSKPYAVGGSVFFPFDRGDYEGIREMIAINPRDGAYDAVDASAQAPFYIPQGYTVIAGSPALNQIAVLSAGDRSALYMFNFYWLGTDRVQSAWHKWTFAPGATTKIYGAEYIGASLYLVIQHDGDGLYLERMDLGDGKDDGGGSGYVTLLDQRLTEADVSIFYNSGSDQTEFTIPYTSDNRGIGVVQRWVTGQPDGGEEFTVDILSEFVVAVSGDISTKKLWLGVEYEQVVAVPDPVIADRDNRPRASGVVRVKRCRVTGKAKTFKTTAQRAGRTDATFTYVVSTLPAGVEFSQRFAIGARNPGVVFYLKNLRPFPSRFLSAEWEIDYANNARR